MFEIELFYHFTVCNWLRVIRLMCNWIVRDSEQYLEPVNFIDLCSIELLKIELFDHLTVCKQMTEV